MSDPLAASAPLGVFDSGLGGLTVVRELRRRFPAQSILYLGDTARVPYGTRSPATVTQYALACADVLVRRHVKALVVACGTVSSVALDTLAREFSLPIVGVITPSARAALAQAGERPIGILGTAGTIASDAYPQALRALGARQPVFTQAAPLLVPLVEEGWLDGEVPRLAARRYLAPLIDAGARVLVLGCTHYPLLRHVLQSEANALSGDHIALVESSSAVANEVAALLQPADRESDPLVRGELELLVTDLPNAFAAMATRFLGEVPGEVHALDLASSRR